MTLEPVIFVNQEKVSPEKIGENCPECSTSTIWRRMPCPEGKPGCLTVHWGWFCPKCLKYFRQKRERNHSQEREIRRGKNR